MMRMKLGNFQNNNQIDNSSLHTTVEDRLGFNFDFDMDFNNEFYGEPDTINNISRKHSLLISPVKIEQNE